MSYSKYLSKYRNKKLTEANIAELEDFLKAETTRRTKDLEDELLGLSKDIDTIKTKSERFEKDVLTKYPEAKFVKGGNKYNYNTRMREITPSHYSIPSKYIDSKSTKMILQSDKYFYKDINVKLSLYNKAGNQRFFIEDNKFIKLHSIQLINTKYQISYTYDYLKSLIPEEILLKNKNIYKKHIIEICNNITKNARGTKQFVFSSDAWLKDELEAVMLLS